MNDSIPAPPPWQLPGAEWRFSVSKDAVGDALHWTWRAIASNGVMWVGDRQFDTRRLCEADAATHGYALEAA